MSAVGRRQPRPCRHIARCHGIRADHSSMRNGWREAQPGRLDVDQSVGPVFYFATFLWWGQHLHEMARMSSSSRVADRSSDGTPMQERWTRHQCEILVIQGYDCLHAFQQGFMQLTFPTSGQHEVQHYITIFSIHNENSHVVTMTSPPAAVERGQLAGRRGRSCSGGAPRSSRTLVNHHCDDQRQPSPPPARPPLPPRLPASTTRGALKVTPPPLLLPSAP